MAATKIGKDLMFAAGIESPANEICRSGSLPAVRNKATDVARYPIPAIPARSRKAIALRKPTSTKYARRSEAVRNLNVRRIIDSITSVYLWAPAGPKISAILHQRPHRALENNGERMNIIGFLQIRNEIASGHLARFLELNLPLFDKLYVYDDASDDGTTELIEKHATKVIRGGSRQFGSELKNKKKLLDLVKQECESGDALIRLDSDEILYCSKEELTTLISDAFSQGYDSITLPHRNLWRAYHWFRTDDHYNDFRPTRVWKLSEKLDFTNKTGLHITTDPIGLRSTLSSDLYPVIHFGFAEKSLILDKYKTYKAHWQSDYPLFRLINETGLSMEKLDPSRENLGARFQDLYTYPDEVTPPTPLTATDWMYSAISSENLTTPLTKPKVTLVSLIYASVTWLEFQYSELLRLSRDLPKGEAEILFIANDATPEVLSFLRENAIPFVEVSTKNSETEWFINSVYRAYNLAVKFAKTDYVVLVNSDMAYSRGALSSLMKRAQPDLFVASRLVELGVMPSGTYGIERDFGSKPKRFRKGDFEKYALEIAVDKIESGGLYMPLLVNREQFLNLGGFPEGNLIKSALQNYLDGSKPEIAERHQELVPGDAAFMMKASLSGIKHVTAFDSVVYHFQAGERRDANKRISRNKSGLAIVNDSLSGINGERVLWEELAEIYAAIGARVVPVEIGFPKSTVEAVTASLRLNQKYISTFRKIQQPRVAFSNATYTLPTPRPARRVVLRQDLPTTRGYLRLQSLVLKSADHIVANDADFVSQRQGRKTSWLPVPLSRVWWGSTIGGGKPKDRARIVFIGAFNDVKGWNRLRPLALARTDIDWVFVSKYSDDQHGLGSDRGVNWVVHRQVGQEDLRQIVRSSSALIVTSPYETQCLVALEAASQNIPVLTTPTGVLGSLGEGLHEFGLVSNRIEQDLDHFLISLNTFSPRDFISKQGFISPVGWQKWAEFLLEQLSESFVTAFDPSPLSKFIDRLRAFAMDKSRLILRQVVIPRLIKIQAWVRAKRPS